MAVNESNSLDPSISHGAGWGNKSNFASRTTDSSNDDESPHFEGGSSTDPYSGFNGVSSGPGFGNKTNIIDGQSLAKQQSETHYDVNAKTATYDEPTGYGKGSTGGAGYGNKMHDVEKREGGDSASGKLMEKLGGIFGNDGMVAKGRTMREEAGLTDGVVGGE